MDTFVNLLLAASVLLAIIVVAFAVHTLRKAPPAPRPPSPWLHSDTGHCIDPGCPYAGVAHGHDPKASPCWRRMSKA